jgi:hypothetical protein
MKKIFSLVLMSALGGALTLGAYKFLFEPTITESESVSVPRFQNVQTNFNTSAKLSSESIDFTKAAEETLSAVVHVQNKSLYTTSNSLEAYLFGRSAGREKVQIGIGSGF